jgi:signal transduction histidine kinase
VNGVPYVVVGARLPGVDALYFEFASLSEYRRTMSILGNVLIVAAAITTVAVATVGWLMSRGVMRPLAEVAGTAQAISGGDLSRRLDVAGDRDLEPVADSFNAMAGSLQQRIEREMRFSADVSHELRTPLTVMSSAVALAQRSELSGRGRYAIELIDGQVEHMRRLTVELLEFARIDAGAAELHLDDVDTVALVREQLDAAGLPSHLLRSDPQSDMIIRADRARLERVVANLLENADRYGCGVTAVTLARSQTEFVLLVDDAGPGVAAEEREAIFDRFHRGTATLRGERPKGTGLGLAMVREHVRLHGGRVNVTDAPEGGARFVVRLPVMP